MSGRVLVCGGREYSDVRKVDAVLYELHRAAPIAVLAAGGARGADTLAQGWALRAQVDYRVYPARWDSDGRAAGPRRNARMLADFQPDLVVAFPGGVGTAHMVRIARAAGVDVREVES